jgi:peptidoglycan/LPS O-acetylase OafA/YrhL
VPSTRPKIDPLTSLRFLAAAMIVTNHAYNLFGQGAIADYLSLMQGVSFFFVLSGFVLAYNYPSLPTRADVARFWVARFARIWPLHAVTCLMFIALIFNLDKDRYFPGGIGWARLAVNLMLLQAWVPYHDWAASFNSVSWTLSVEFFFYALFPLLLALWPRRWHVILAVQAAVAVAFVFVSQQLALPSDPAYRGIGLQNALYFNPLARMLEFSVGIGVAFLVVRFQRANITLRASRWLVLEVAVLLAAFVMLARANDPVGIRNHFGEAAAYYFKAEGLWILWAAVVWIFAVSRGPVAAFLSLPAMVFLGEISYALYLVHFMLVIYLEPYTAAVRTYGAAGYAAFWAACIFLSALLFSGVEKPLRHAILGWWDRRGAPAAPGRSIRAPVSLVHVAALASIVGLMVVFRPTNVVPLGEEQVADFVASSRALPAIDGGVFGQQVAVLGVQVKETRPDKVDLSILLRSEKDVDPNVFLAVHLNDADGKVIDKGGDHLLEHYGRAIPAGRTWIAHYDVRKEAFKDAASISIAAYVTPAALFNVSGALTDWGGRRLVLPLTQGVAQRRAGRRVRGLAHDDRRARWRRVRQAGRGPRRPGESGRPRGRRSLDPPEVG